MNPLLAQFVEEAADLLANVDSGLLALERDPSDHDVLDDIFRAAHTLKGSSGLFDIGPLTRLTHAAEDVLDAVRSGDLPVTSELVDAVMVAFDLVGVWVGALATHEVLPEDAARTAAPGVRALRALLDERVTGGGITSADEDSSSGPPPVGPDIPSWAATLPGAAEGGVALRYTPAPDCFFKGEDPLHLIRQLAGLCHLEISREGAWPAMDDLDEYDCRLVLTALARCSLEDAATLFRYVPDQVDLVHLPEPQRVTWAGTSVPTEVLRQAHTVLQAQVAVLTAFAAPASKLPPGALAAARTVLRGTLTAAGCDASLVRVGGADPSDAVELLTLAQRLLTEADAALLGSEPGPGDDADGADGSQAASPDAAATSTGTSRGTGSSAGTGGGESAPAPRGVGRALKVDQEKIDRIMELVGELIVAKNALPFLAREAEEEYGVPALARSIKGQYGVLDRLAEELQTSVMDVRMVPMSMAFGRFPRLVRDVARKLGKQVHLLTEGEETRADKDVIDLIADPLVHLVRNSLDHGIEQPEQRRSAGKPELAVLTIAASRDGDAVLVEVSDDGRGIDPDRLRAKAVERGLLDPDHAAGLSEAEALDLAFLPGLSTAGAVSDLSGRGVGMDAVRTAVQRLGGTVTLSSRLGQGTTVRLRVPLTMAVSRVMIVGVGGQRFGVPIDTVQETVRVPPETVLRVRTAEAILLRDRLVPLVSLHRLLDVPGPAADADLAVLVVRVGGETLGLTVDRFHDNLDVVVKPLRGVIASAKGFAGTALLGDGDVLLIIDAKELLHAG